jgi:hypothetical protein
MGEEINNRKRENPGTGEQSNDEQKRYSNRMGEQMTMNKRDTVTGWESDREKRDV